MSLLFFLKPVFPYGTEERYFKPSWEGVKPKPKKVYRIEKEFKTAYAKEISLKDFAADVSRKYQAFKRQRDEEFIITQLILMDEL